MERVGKAHSEKLKSVLLYSDDIAELYRIFEKGCESVEVEAAGYKLQGPDELGELNDEVVSELHILGRKPYVSLEFRPNDVHLYISEDTHHQIGIFEELKKFVNGRKRRLSWLTQSSLGAGLLGGAAFQFIPTTQTEVTAYSVTLVGAMFITAIGWGWWSFYSSFKKYSVIYTHRKRSEGSFFRRRKDELYLAIVSALVGSVITILLTKIF